MRRSLFMALVVAVLAGAALQAVHVTPARGASSAEFRVATEGSGTGKVTGPAGARSWNGSVLSGQCSSEEPVPESTPLVYTAAVGPGSRFSGWKGCSEVEGTLCYVDREELASEIVVVTARFDRVTYRRASARRTGAACTAPGSTAGPAAGTVSRTSRRAPRACSPRAR